MANVNAVSDSVPMPPERARPRMLATGVSIVRQPDFATWPVLKPKLPRAISNRAECKVPLESQTKSFNTMRVLLDRLNAVPSMKRMPIWPSAAVSMTSPWQTGSPTLTCATAPLARVRVPEPNTA